MKLIESKTYVNLAKAFSGECQARTRYEFIEFGARQQGYKEMAEIIDEIVYNEFNHARMFYTKIQDASDKPIENIEYVGGFPFKEKWDLEENLKFAASDEEAEIVMYPKFAITAKGEGFTEIATLFNNIAKIESNHKKIFLSLYDQLKKGTMYKKEKQVVYKCASCGYETTDKECFKVCPVCQAKQGSVKIYLN